MNYADVLDVRTVICDYRTREAATGSKLKTNFGRDFEWLRVTTTKFNERRVPPVRRTSFQGVAQLEECRSGRPEVVGS